MMRLSTMVKVDSTIRENGSSPIAEQILERWAYDDGSVRFFRSSANFIYRFHDQGRPRFLRFADGRERSRETVTTEVAIVDAVASAGIPVATPVDSKYGNAVETVDTECGTFHAVVFRALPGSQCELDELDNSGFRQWGAALSGLHTALSKIANPPARPMWLDHLESVKEYLPEDSPYLQAEFEDITASLTALPVSAETYGLTHCDFELDNLIWGSTAVGILDFDDCSRLWYVADVALALRDLFERGADTSNPRFCAFVDGYRQNHPLSDESIAHLPLFLRYAHLRTYARLARSLDLTSSEDYPEWLLQLHGKLLHRMAAYRASVESRRG